MTRPIRRPLRPNLLRSDSASRDKGPHLRRGPSFNYVYVVNGLIKDAGDPLGDHFGPASKLFPSTVVDGIEKELQELPPVRSILDANDLRRGKEGVGGLKSDAVIISLGLIERKKGLVHVSNGLYAEALADSGLPTCLRTKVSIRVHSRRAGPRLITLSSAPG
jgi:hypothetical protein